MGCCYKFLNHVRRCSSYFFSIGDVGKRLHAISALTTIYNNEINFNFSDSLHYLLPSGDGFSFVQRQKQRKRPFEFFQDIKIENQLAANKDLILRFQSKYAADRSLTTNATDISVFTDHSKLVTSAWYGGISYLHKLSSNWVNTLDFEMGSNRLDERFVLSEGNTAKDSISQNTDHGLFNIGIFDRLDGVVKKNWFVNILNGWSQTSSDFVYVQNLLEGDTRSTSPYQFDHLFSQFELGRKIKESRISLGGRMRNVTVQYTGESSNRSYFELTVMAFTKKVLGKISAEASGLYNVEYVFLKPNQLVNTSLLSDYRTAISFTANPNAPVKNEIGVASIKLTEDKTSFISANAEWIYLKSNSILASQLVFVGNTVLNNQVQDGASKSFFSTYSIDKYLSKIGSTVKIAYDYNQSTVPLTIQESSDASRLQQSILSITSGTSITNQVSLSWAFKHSKSTNKWAEEKNSFRFKNYFTKIVYKPMKYLSLSFDYQAIDFTKSDDFSSIFNFVVFYSILEDQLSVEMTGNNILNKKAIVLSTIEPSAFAQSLYPLQPRFVLISVNYRF